MKREQIEIDCLAGGGGAVGESGTEKCAAKARKIATVCVHKVWRELEVPATPILPHRAGLLQRKCANFLLAVLWAFRLLLSRLVYLGWLLAV